MIGPAEEAAFRLRIVDFLVGPRSSAVVDRPKEVVELGFAVLVLTDKAREAVGWRSLRASPRSQLLAHEIRIFLPILFCTLGNGIGLRDEADTSLFARRSITTFARGGSFSLKKRLLRAHKLLIARGELETLKSIRSTKRATARVVTSMSMS
jgi:hypothetical protein